MYIYILGQEIKTLRKEFAVFNLTKFCAFHWPIGPGLGLCVQGYGFDNLPHLQQWKRSLSINFTADHLHSD
jgi:hypothetical protein